MHLGTGCAVSAVSAKRSPRFLAEALELARRGASVLPLRPQGKEPLTPHGCHDASRDEATVRAWWTGLPDANVGLATGAGLLVLDVDPRHGGDDSVADLPPLPPTREAATGGGGRHLYYRAGVKIRCSAGRLGPGLDVRGEGGYVVAPPSVHPSGQLYRWREGCGLSHSMADAPTWLLERILPRPPAATAPCLEAPPDLTRRADRARRYVSRVQGAVSGQGGHQATWLVALALVRGFDLPADVAYEILASDFNPRCEPPWSERELRHKVESAARDATVERGYLLRQKRSRIHLACLQTWSNIKERDDG